MVLEFTDMFCKFSLPCDAKHVRFHILKHHFYELKALKAHKPDSPYHKDWLFHTKFRRMN
jgi:hypothetical protein